MVWVYGKNNKEMPVFWLWDARWESLGCVKASFLLGR